MTTSTIRVLTCRWIVPVGSDPIQGGWIRLLGDEIIEVGRSSPPSDAEDLGDVVLLPGLVNSHTHLEFSDLDRPIGQPGVALSAWIGQVIAARADRSQHAQSSPHAQSSAIARGIDESARAHVRLIGDIATPPCDYGSLQSNAPEIVSFAEVIGLSLERSGLRYEAALEHLQSIYAAAISAHAPYSTTRQAIQRCIETSIMTNRPLAMHVAESPAERELLIQGTGPFAESLRSLGVWQDGLFPWEAMDFGGTGSGGTGFGGTGSGDGPIIQLIRLLGRCPSALLVHGNDLSDDEIAILKQHPRITVVYCPRTHAFFGYDRHPVAKLIAAGIRVALGTDSRASNPDLSVLGEVQWLLNHRPDLDPADVIAMATIRGADALMRPDVGRIAVGCRPGLMTVATDATTIDGVYESLAQA